MTETDEATGFRARLRATWEREKTAGAVLIGMLAVLLIFGATEIPNPFEEEPAVAVDTRSEHEKATERISENNEWDDRSWTEVRRQCERAEILASSPDLSPAEEEAAWAAVQTVCGR